MPFTINEVNPKGLCRLRLSFLNNNIIIIILMNNQSISLDGSNVVYATEFISVSETGTSSIKQDFATITYVDNEISNINVGAGGGISQADLDTQLAPIIAQNTGQDLVITDINNNLSNNFQTTAQLNTNFYSKT